MDADGVEQATLHLPVGTVTFVLTDVVGSMRLREFVPEAMGAAVARHDELLDAAITLHSGVRLLEQGEGDSVVAAFIRASDAVAAALDVQRAFHSEGWPEGAPVRLRVALHIAEAQRRDEEQYFGQAVNRCARSRTVARSCCPGRRVTWSSTGSPSMPSSPTSISIGCATLGGPSTSSDWCTRPASGVRPAALAGHDAQQSAR